MAEKKCNAKYLPDRQKGILKTFVEQRSLGVNELSRIEIMRLQGKGNCSYSIEQMLKGGVIVITKKVVQSNYYALNPALTDKKINELLKSEYSMSEDCKIKKSRKNTFVKRDGKPYGCRKYENVDNKTLMYELIGKAYQPGRDVTCPSSFSRSVTV